MDDLAWPNQPRRVNDPRENRRSAPGKMKEVLVANIPRQGTAFVDFARRVVEILTSNPWGVDQESFLHEYYGGNPPTDLATRSFQWEEFKRAKDYSHQMFKNGVDGWLWVRARHGNLPHQFFYQAVAIIVGGEPEVIIRYPVSEALLIDKTGDWYTRTRSQMRVTVANITAKKRAAIATGNTRLLEQAEAELDEIVVLAPRLAAINFDTGITVQDLRVLANSPRVPRLLHNSVKRTLRSYERSQHEIRNLSRIIYSLKAIRTGTP